MFFQILSLFTEEEGPRYQKELLNQLMRLEDEVAQQQTEKQELLKQVKREQEAEAISRSMSFSSKQFKWG